MLEEYAETLEDGELLASIETLRVFGDRPCRGLLRAMPSTELFELPARFDGDCVLKEARLRPSALSGDCDVGDGVKIF